MNLTKRERILMEHLSGCRDKLRVERKVAEHLLRTRIKLQKAFTKKVDELRKRTDLLQAEVDKLKGTKL